MLGYRFAPSQMKHKLDQEPSEHIFCQQHVKGASSHEQNPEAAACGPSGVPHGSLFQSTMRDNIHV